MGATTSAFQRVGLVILIALVFLFGLGTTVYLSLRTTEVTVPEVVGKDRFEAERILADADLNFRVRAHRPSNQVKADTVLFQLPRPGEVVKAGQTVAMDISRAAKEGEASEADVTDKKASEDKAAEARNSNGSTNSRNDNENRPKRTRNANKNANENTNANAGTRNANANRARTVADNTNSNNSGTGSNNNLNPGRNANQNDNRRSPAPRPSPTSRNVNGQSP